MRLRFEHGRRDELKTLNPAYFAMVMATGIVSIAAHLHAVPVVPTALLWLNGLFFVALAAATVARILRYPQAFAADIANHGRGVGFFTTVAGTAALGTQLFVQINSAGIAAGLSEAACAGEGQRINQSVADRSFGRRSWTSSRRGKNPGDLFSFWIGRFPFRQEWLARRQVRRNEQIATSAIIN